MKRKEFLQQSVKGAIGFSSMVTLLNACTKKIAAADDADGDTGPALKHAPEDVYVKLPNGTSRG
jgi:hypothetical protein